MVYSIGIFIYMLGVICASLVSKKARKMVEGIAHTYSILKAEIKPDDRVVWFHAASLGEFEQGRPLMERLRLEHPEYKILLTFFSPSGYEVRKNYEGADVICYLPFDTIGNALSFIRIAHPEIAIFIKYEFWKNYLTIARHRGVKLYSVSSIFRPGQYFFQWYGSAKVLRQFDHLFVQNEQSKELLHSIGIDCTTVVGDTRLDRVIDIKNAAKDLPLVEQFVGNSHCFVAGSSWGPDEEIYIPYFAKHKDWKLIIAPHVISEVHLKSIDKLLAANGLTSVRYTDIEKGAPVPEGTNVIIVNCFGKLSSIYRYGKVAVVGGGFGVGIHNVPEAAVYGIPVLFGPNNRKFKEAQELKACGGSFEYVDADSFASLMDNFINNPDELAKAGAAAGRYINGNAGAADKCFKAIFDAH
ncbi:MAG: 3-deoxy-D-manno-octulosonic acid transferase [Bacteroidaceae bacterium]|nr:3-deoxy-D-manno-octulosonic acid transferase [Bacteroidaceae bacterium]